MADQMNMSVTDQDLREKVAALLNECVKVWLEKKCVTPHDTAHAFAWELANSGMITYDEYKSTVLQMFLALQDHLFELRNRRYQYGVILQARDVFPRAMLELSRVRSDAIYHLQWALRTLPKLGDQPEEVPRYREALRFIEGLGDEDKECHICHAKPGEQGASHCSRCGCVNCTWKEGKVIESCPEHDENRPKLKEGDPCPVCDGTGMCPTCGTSCMGCVGTGECDAYTVGDIPWKCECGVLNDQTLATCPGCGKAKPDADWHPQRGSPGPASGRDPQAPLGLPWRVQDQPGAELLLGAGSPLHGDWGLAGRLVVPTLGLLDACVPDGLGHRGSTRGCPARCAGAVGGVAEGSLLDADRGEDEVSTDRERLLGEDVMVRDFIARKMISLANLERLLGDLRLAALKWKPR